MKITVVPTITMTVLAPGFTLFFPSFLTLPLIKTLTMLPLTETLIIRFFFLTVTFTTGLVAADVAEGFGVADAVGVGVAAGVGFTVDGTTVRTA